LKNKNLADIQDAKRPVVKRFKDINSINLPDYKEDDHDKDYYIDIIGFDPKSKMKTHNYPVLDMDGFEE